MIAKLLLLFERLCYSMPLIVGYLIFSVIICLIYINHKKKKQYAIKNNDFYVLKLFDFMHVKHIWADLGKIFVFFLTTIGFLILLRLLNFGRIFIIWDIFAYKAKTAPNILLIIILIFLMYFHIKMIFILLKDTFYKVHLYFFNNKIYFSWIDFLWDKAKVDFSLISNISYFLLRSLQDEESIIFSDRVIFFRLYLKKNTLLKFLLTKIQSFITNYFFLYQLEITCYYYMPYIFMYCVLIYDLKHYEIKYFYFAIFIFSVINIYRKMKKFISHLDFYDCDKVLYNYLYKSNIHNQLMAAKTFNKRSTLMGRDVYAWEIFNDHMENIKKYVMRDYVIHYVDIKFKRSYEPYSARILYLLIFISYIIFCYNLSVMNGILISVPLLLSYVIYEYCFYKYKKEKLYKMPYVISYILLLGCAIIILIWIYLTRHTLFFMNDFIWSYKFNIQQSFTITEKISFLKEYISFKMQYMHIHEKLHLINIFKDIPLYDLLQTVTIIEIKEYIDNFISLHSKLENEIYPLLKDKIQEQHKIKASSDSIFDILFNISLITIIAILFKLK